MGEVMNRSMEQIATEINVIKQQTTVMLLQASVEIGKRLQEAKALVGHGNWGKWLKENVDYSDRTAQNLMAIYTEYSAMPNLDAFSDLTYSKAVALLALPQEEREEFKEKNKVEDMSTRELETKIKELKEAQAQNEAQQTTIEQLNGDVERAAEEAEQAKAEAETAKKEAAEAKKTAASAEKLKKALEKEKEAVAKAKEKADQLKEQLEKEKNKEPEKVEVIPADVQKELDRLKAVEKKAPNEAVVKFRVLYEEWQIKLNALVAAVTDIEKVDEKAAAKYRAAIKKACSTVAESIDKK